MENDQNRGKTNDEPVDDALSALRRLATLDKTGPDISHPTSSSHAGELVDTMPDWLELLLAKYGERASNLIGIETDVLVSLPPGGLADSPPTGKEESEMASLLEQMAAKAEVETSEQLLAQPEDEVTEDQEPDWLDQVAEQYEAPPTAPAFEEEAPDWLSEIGELEPEAQAPADGPEGAEYSADAEEVPDWLQELPPAPQPAKPSPPAAAPSEDDIPDWMEELSAAVPSVEPSEAAQEARHPHEDEVPDWMKDLVFDAPQVEDQPPADQMATSPPATPEAEKAETEVPDWLAQLAEAPDLQAGEPEQPAEAELLKPSVPEFELKAPAEPEEEAPDWLSRLQTLEEAPAGEPPPEIAAEVTAPEAEEEIPDWLRELETPGAALPTEPPTVEPPPEVVTEAPAEPEATDTRRSTARRTTGSGATSRDSGRSDCPRIRGGNP
jgi:Meckel syndrome type 1 protein